MSGEATVTVTTAVTFIPGRDYEVAFQVPGSRAEVMRAGFLGTAGEADLHFDQRPAAGNCTVKRAWVVGAREVPRDHSRRHPPRRPRHAAS
jgi:hypothetical protein